MHPSASGGQSVESIKVLLVEDNPIDAELELMEFHRAGIGVEHRVVCTEETFRGSLDEFHPDVVLCDFSFPAFAGFEALRITREERPETPFIFVSGTLTEEKAMIALQNGAVDYVLKSNLTRLVNAVQRALGEARERRRRLEAEAARDRALDASQIKSEFVATISHELRTPLNAIIGMSELLETGLLDERQRTCLRVINSSAETLLSVINGILDFSKIEAGKLDLNSRPFSVAAVVDATVSVLKGQAARKGLDLRCTIDHATPMFVGGDGDRLRQILLNLAGNAIKFTEEGEIEIRAAPLGLSESRVMMRFEVKDSGSGIADESRTSLFEPFVQVNGSSRRRFAGTGLGLSISKRLVELMDGEIGVTSTLGSGSTFWFTANFDRVEEGAGIESEAASVEPLLESIGPVLVAEDNALIQDLLVRQFELLGLRVTVVSDGLQALDAARAERFALIFMDCQMPNMDGFEATKAIREDERSTGAHVPIVAMTANAFREDREACLVAGMDDHLSKPVRLRELRRMIKRWAPD